MLYWLANNKIFIKLIMQEHNHFDFLRDIIPQEIDFDRSRILYGINYKP
jgi:hypothetical protein